MQLLTAYFYNIYSLRQNGLAYYNAGFVVVNLEVVVGLAYNITRE
jgi:hypothetical protein